MQHLANFSQKPCSENVTNVETTKIGHFKSRIRSVLWNIEHLEDLCLIFALLRSALTEVSRCDHKDCFRRCKINFYGIYVSSTRHQMIGDIPDMYIRMFSCSLDIKFPSCIRQFFHELLIGYNESM